MGVPKRKTSKMRLRTRRAAKPLARAAAQPLPPMQQPRPPAHRCPSCGYYKGRQVLTIEA